jgi:hypothetical protein
VRLRRKIKSKTPYVFYRRKFRRDLLNSLLTWQSLS